VEDHNLIVRSNSLDSDALLELPTTPRIDFSGIPAKCLNAY
jgi:hypothetical protein